MFWNLGRRWRSRQLPNRRGYSGLDVGFGNMYLRNPGSSPVTGIGRRLSCSSLPIPQHYTFRVLLTGDMCSSLHRANSGWCLFVWQKPIGQETVPSLSRALGVWKTCIQMHWYTPTRLPNNLPFLWVEMNSSLSHCMMLLQRKLTERIFQGKQHFQREI